MVKISRARFVVTLVALAALCGPTLAQVGDPIDFDSEPWLRARSDRAVQGAPPDRVNVLVRVEGDRAALRDLATAEGGFVKYEYETVAPDIVALRNIPIASVDKLLRTPGVVGVEPDQFFERVINLDESMPLIRGLQSQLSTAGLSADGAGVRVCVVDTGIDTDHAFYTDRIDFAASYDFHNGDPNPEDDNGHGAHVAGIAVGGLGSVSLGCEGTEDFQGVAPAATLIGVKVLNSGGGGLSSNIVAGIDHCADQSASGGQADVINLSIGTGQFGSPCNSDAWAAAANNAVAAGVVVVAAAGNEGYSNALSTPACGSDVIAVAATYKDNYPNCENGQANFTWCLTNPCFVTCTDNSPAVDSLVCFSNNSSMLDVAAPGAMILSASTAAGGTSLTEIAGTSQASPHVAGLAALVLDVNPTLTPAQVRQAIRDGAVDMGPAGFDVGYGYGRIDAIDTLNLVSTCTNNSDCDDGLFCNGAETCVSSSCQAGVDPCPGQGCDEVADVCVPLVCDQDGTCESGEDCNNCAADCPSGGGQVCGNGVCEPGEDCLSCATDCRGKTNGKPDRQYCCSGNPGGGGGPNPIDCGDSRCTSEGFQCSFSANAFCCGDGTCDTGEDGNNCAIDCSCVTNADCDDGVPCTDDVCQAGGVCSNTPNDANCPDDGQFCNGAEFCDAGSGCSSAGDPCGSGETCNETTDQCDSCLPKNASCSLDGECCSGVCKANGRCR